MRPLALLCLALAATACSSSAPTADVPDTGPADTRDPDAAWDWPVEGAGWTITPPPGLHLARHDAAPIEWWTFRDDAGAIVFTVRVAPYAGTAADLLATCRDPDAWGWHCTAQPDVPPWTVMRWSRGEADLWRHALVHGGRLWEVDVDASLSDEARATAVASFVVR